ncbi:hypothetical protein IU402_05470 [Aerococcaceae bacterium zg-BR9]|nr:hypothetical protein [Aerococcaceae bacterium zg-BR9]
MDKMRRVFEALNHELFQANLRLTIICVGGYVLEYHGLRATQDVDAFYEENQKIRKSENQKIRKSENQKINAIIARVGQQFNLNTNEELWLNKIMWLI